MLITLAIVMGGYSLAALLHLSGPLAMVVAFSIIVQGTTLKRVARRVTVAAQADTVP